MYARDDFVRELAEVLMAKEVTCPPCGAIVRGNDDSELLANVRQHALDHGHEVPLGMTVEDFEAHILNEAREVSSA
jgi:hypothetical protein